MFTTQNRKVALSNSLNTETLTSENSIVYLSLDYITCLNIKNYDQIMKAHMQLTFAEKMAHLKAKLLAGYEHLRKLNPDSYIFIVMRECAIEDGNTERPWVRSNILSVEQKNSVLMELKALTKDRALILAPGSIAHAITSDKGTTIYNRAYIFVNGEIAAYQDKVTFHDSDTEDTYCKFKNLHTPVLGDYNELGKKIDYQTIELKIHSNFTLKVRIDICRDHHHNPSQDGVDLHLVPSNATFSLAERNKGRMFIHCDGNRPTTFIAKEIQECIYLSNFIAANNDIYKLNALDSHAFLRDQDNDGDNYARRYPIEKIYQPTQQVKAPPSYGNARIGMMWAELHFFKSSPAIATEFSVKSRELRLQLRKLPMDTQHEFLNNTTYGNQARRNPS